MKQAISLFFLGIFWVFPVKAQPSIEEVVDWINSRSKSICETDYIRTDAYDINTGKTNPVISKYNERWFVSIENPGVIAITSVESGFPRIERDISFSVDLIKEDLSGIKVTDQLFKDRMKNNVNADLTPKYNLKLNKNYGHVCPSNSRQQLERMKKAILTLQKLAKEEELF